ncbi:hypothetical protein H9Q69_008968 [Fusarium xylarioides]|nr:hypothetical protein H9Q69_008968 [Fusarium xylarioides]
MEANSSEMIRELHSDLRRKWKAHGPKVETAWRSFNKAQRAKCMKAGAMEGQVLKHSRDASLGNVCKFIPEWNLKDITDPDSDLLLDILKHRAKKSMTEQYRSGHNGTAGDLDLIDEMTRTRNLRHVDDFKNCFTFFDEREYGFSFRVPAGQNVNEALSGMESAMQQRYIIPQSLGELILQRQLYLLQALNIMIEDVLDRGSETRDRSQLAKNSKPVTALSDSASKQAAVKLNPQELSTIASDQKSSLEEYLSLLRTEPTVLCAGVNVQFFSRPELVPDEKGRSLPVHTDKYVGPAVFEAIHHAVQGIAVWESITGLLDLLEKPSTDKLYKSTILQELSNMCHWEYARTQKGNLLVAGLQEVDTELNQIKKDVDLRDYAAPIDNLLEPDMSTKALEALDAFVAEKTGTKMGSLYQDEVEKAFRNVEEQYQQAKNKANKDSKVDFVPIDTTPVDAKERFETRRQKEKTRPEHSSVYAIAPTTDSTEEKEVVTLAQPLKVSSSTAEVFSTLFDKTQSRGSASWSSFEAAMSELGFSVLPRFGSVYTSRPSEDMDIKRPVSIHRPHQSQIEGYLILILARRLNRAYGWSEDSFVAE